MGHFDWPITKKQSVKLWGCSIHWHPLTIFAQVSSFQNILHKYAQIYMVGKCKHTRSRLGFCTYMDWK
jgi:hypothetical protein